MAFGDERRRERDFERFLTFVDAVVAIAISVADLRRSGVSKWARERRRADEAA